MVKVNVVGVPLDEEVVFIVSLLIFLMLTAQYFINSDFELQYTSGIGAFLSALSIYVFYKMHLIEERMAMPMSAYVSAPSAPARSRRK
ncbi:MAG TPA: hypothetical protein VJI13_05130 [Candidatus Norongarragalinales archaeon]|nr:hypothetical protein [Candidatus Norongarragalinales archaeon]